MDPWVLSDGTEISLGGNVSGDSLVAEFARRDMRDAKDGNVCSNYGAQPHVADLDIDVPHLMDHYIRNRYDVASGPDVEYPTEEPRPDPPEGAVY